MTWFDWKLRLCSYYLAALLTMRPALAAKPSREETAMPTVVVTGVRESYRVKRTALSKYTQPLVETPQTVNVVPAQLIKDQAAVTTREALRNVPGISLAAGEGGFQGDSLTIRGFSARSDFFIDGMRDFGSYFRDPFNLQQIEVLQGPASVMFGRGSTGGIVNQQAKSPRLEAFNDEQIILGSDRTRRMTVDVNEPLANLGKGTAVRVNAMGTAANVAGRDIAENNRNGAAVAMATGLGTETRFTFYYFKQSEDNIPDYGLPWFRSRVPNVRRDNFYGFATRNFLENDVDIFTLRAEHDLTDKITLRYQGRNAHYGRNAQISQPQIAATIPGTTPLGNISVTRNQVTALSEEGLDDHQLDLLARFNTGSIRHNVATGFEYAHETSDPVRRTFAGVPTTSLVTPNPYQPFAGTPTITQIVNAKVDTTSAYLVDTIGFAKKWDLVAGARYDNADASFINRVGNLGFAREDDFTSWRYALVYKPERYGSIYFAQGTSFNPSAEQLSLSAATANVAPEQSRTTELGTKWELPDPRILVYAAIFESRKLNARETDPNNPLQNILSGEQEAKGYQIGAAGALTERWNITGGYAFVDSAIVRTVNPNALGRPLPNAPRHTFTVFSTYRLTNKVEVGGGVNATSERSPSSIPDANTGLLKEAPGYVTANFMGRYQLSERVNVQGSLINAFDKFYLEGLQPGHAIPGAGQTFLVTTSLRL
jgi:catecholate siderophore receptor